MEKDVRRLRPWVDVLVVSMHWGRNYRPVNEDQERDARFLSSLGVDIIAGHHPHDIQRVQWIGHTLVIYSLGNYAWGTPGHGSMRVGLLARLYLSQHTAAARGRLRAVTFLPLVTQNRIVHLQPRAIRRSEKRWLNTFLSRSRAHGAKLTWRGIQLDLAVPPAKR